MAGKKKPDSIKSADLSPDDIRRIREALGLSQVEAGELLGGGPRAFTKYEGGTIKPAASVANLLRILDSNPSAFTTLTGRKARPISQEGGRLLEVTGEHVAALSDRKLVMLTRRLLNAEAQVELLGMDQIHVAAKITAPDGGEDARIEWTGGPDRTKFLPARLCQFQMKATEISPAEAGADVLASTGQVKAMVRDALEAGGVYVVLCARSYTKQEIKRREVEIRKSLSKAGLKIGGSRIQFRDADQIADWVNQHPAVAAWLLEQTQPGLVGPFRDWSHWAGRHEHQSSSWISDERLDAFREKLRMLVTAPKGVARVVGLSGYGKSRLVLEALGPTEHESETRIRLCDLVLYAVEQEVGAEAVKAVVQSLADAGLRAIIVVDQCPKESHQDLAAMVKRSSSQLSLVTIDHEVPTDPKLPNDTLLVGPAPPAVIEGMLKAIAPDVAGEDRRRLIKLASGFPQLAQLIGDAWLQDISVASAPDELLIGRILLGRNQVDAQLTMRASMLLGAFGLVGAKPPLDDELEEIAKFGRNLQAEDLRSVIGDLVARGVAQMRGRLVELQPRPIALHLAEKQWREWGPDKWDAILAGDTSKRLKTRAARQLALLDREQISTDVIRHVCRSNGGFASLAAVNHEGNTEVLSALAYIDPEAIISLLEQVLGRATTEEKKSISGDARRHLVWGLEKITFAKETFERGALLLLELAVSENETWGNNATGQFKSLFPSLLANTEAGPEERLRLIDDIVASGDPVRLPIAINALLEGAKTDSFTRTVGSEVRGTRPALKSWTPQFWEEVWAYVRQCANRLTDLARRTDEIGAQARAGLGHQLRFYVLRGLLDDVERWVAVVTAAHTYWPQALNSLGDVLQYDLAGLEPGVEARVRLLVEKLTPNDLAARVRFLVTEMPWDYPIAEQLDYEVRQKRQIAAVDQLAGEVLNDEQLLLRLLPQLSRGDQRMTDQFGMSIAKAAANPMNWRSPIIDALRAAPSSERNYGLVTGFFVGLVERDPKAFDAFKVEASVSIDLAPALALVCVRAGIRVGDIPLVCSAVSTGLMPAFALRSWAGGGELAKQPAAAVAPLFDLLFEMEQPYYSIGLDLLGMYVFTKQERLEELRPQLRLAATNVNHIGKRPGAGHMDAHHFRELVQWILSKGESDRDACAIVMTLAKTLVAMSSGSGDELIRPLLPVMLSKFPQITWPIIGQGIVSDKKKAWMLQSVLGDPFSFDNKQAPPLLHLPIELLFAWCHAHPDIAPAFVASVVSVLTHRDRTAGDPELHPVTRRLLDEFGNRDEVLKALVSNMHSFGWSGSRTNYFALYETPLRSLKTHPIGAVRRWSQKMLTSMHREIEAVRDEDDERDASWEG